MVHSDPTDGSRTVWSYRGGAGTLEGRGQVRGQAQGHQVDSSDVCGAQQQGMCQDLGTGVDTQLFIILSVFLNVLSSCNRREFNPLIG